ncbi:MAG: pyrroloquinoline quinone biosynthesis protein PqqB [Deltaproteobacteria bacterium]|nr:pyrroloquinoline quinone biosynthesis protein PqqB [Deltaproteobacteria bacterium]
MPLTVIVLGSSAGGGLPQWNCNCPQCAAARGGDPMVPPRSQSSIAVSADGERWLLCNASPDVRTQLAQTPALHPRALRHSPIAAVALTNADIDHATGLLILREGGAPPVYCTARTERALTDGLRVLPALASYGAVTVRRLTPGSADPEVIRDRAGEDIGVRLRAFTVASKPPPYMLPLLSAEEIADLHAGDTVGLELSSADGATSVVYVPGVLDLDASLHARLSAAGLVLIDGTFFTDDEMIASGASQKTSRLMGHAPLTGAGGLLEFLQTVTRPRKALVHINNSNPALRADSPERRSIEEQGVALSSDGDTFVVG